MPPAIKEILNKDVEYQLRDGILSICVNEVIEKNELTYGSGYDEYVVQCYFVIYAKYENREYVSMTAVNVII